MINIPRIDFKNLPKQDQQKILVVLVAILLAGAACYLFLLGPGWKFMVQCHKEIALLETKAQEAKKVLSSKDSIVKEGAEIREKLKELPKWIPEEGDSSWILRLVGEVEHNLNMRTVAIKPVAEKDMEREMKELDFKEGEAFRLASCMIELKTDYHSFGRFIDGLERQNPYLKMANLSIKSSGDDNTRCSATFKIHYPVARRGNAGMNPSAPN